jgi:hypothetical protein
MDADGSIGEAA